MGIFPEVDHLVINAEAIKGQCTEMLTKGTWQTERDVKIYVRNRHKENILREQLGPVLFSVRKLRRGMLVRQQWQQVEREGVGRKPWQPLC